MERRVHRPVPSMGTYHSFTEMLSENHIEGENDDSNYMSTRSPVFHPYSTVGSQGQTSDDVASQMNHVDIPHSNRGRVRWNVADTLILIEAKRIEKDLHTTGGVMKKTQTSTERWKAIEKYCYDNGVARSANQCRDRWEHVMPEYKKVRDYENNIPSGHASYWAMTNRERTEKKLPTNLFEEIFSAMDNNFGRDRSINPGNITVDTSATMNEQFKDTSLPDQNVQTSDRETGLPHRSHHVNPNYTSDATDNQSTGKRRRSMSKTTGLKDVLIENNKMIVSSFEVAEEGRAKRHSEKMIRDEQNSQRMIAIEEQKVTIEKEKVKVQ